MKFKLDRDVLRGLLERTAGAVCDSDVRPILRNFLLRVEPDRIRVMATDLSLGALVEMETTDVLEGGTACIPASKFLDMAKAAPDGPILVVLKPGFELAVHGGYRDMDKNGNPIPPESKALWTLHCLLPDQYPDFPTFDIEKSTVCAVKPLHDVLSRIEFAPSEDKKRRDLGVVMFDAGKVYASDLQVVVRANLETGLSNVRLPIEAVRLLIPLLKKTSCETLNIQVTHHYLLFRIGNDTYHCRQLEGGYPDLETKVVAKTNNFTGEFAVDRKELVDAIKRASIVKDERYWLTVACVEGRCMVGSRDNISNKYAERLDTAKWSRSDNFERHVNLSFILKVLQSCRGQRVTLRIGEGTTVEQLMLRIDEEDFTAVLYPLRLVYEKGEPRA